MIGVSQCSDDEWREIANNQMSLEAEYYGIKLRFRSAGDDTRTQKQDINELLSEGVDLLVISPNESEGLTSTITDIYKKGIPVILYDRKTENDQYTAFVGADNRQIGVMAADYLSIVMSGAGNVFVVRGTPGSSADEERFKGLTERLSQHPQINIESEITGNFSYREAYNAATSRFKGRESHLSSIDAIFALNDRMALGVHDALTDLGYARDDIPPIIGVDAMMLGMNAIAEGKMKASFMYPTGGDLVIDLARKILMGLEYERKNTLNTSVVDENNVRLLLSQHSEINNNEQKMKELNNRVSEYINRTFILGLVICAAIILLLVVIILLVITFRSNKTKGLLLDKLNEQNEHILDQVEALELQKNELVVLSHQLEETTSAKLSFFTNISHEFKTPLSLISGPVEDLLNMSDIPSAATAKLEILKRNNSKLSRLIGELLDFRAADTGNVNINTSMGNLGDFIADIIKMFEDVISKRNLHFSFEKKGDNFVIPFDPVKTEKVFTNLLSNAFNHVDRYGTIRVFLESDAAQYRISVFNSGSYIPESNRDKVFRQFYTLDATQRGTGIGLALVTSLVNVMHGAIELESKENEGTTFSVSVPIDGNVVADMEFDSAGYKYLFARQKHDTMGEDYDNSGIYDDVYSGPLPVVLVIEDNIDMRQYILDALSSDYHVILAKDGEIGVKKALMFNPAIIISDIMMPNKDGYEVCRELKSKELLSNVPIILLTACSMDEQRARGYECGADGYMQKPFSVMTLKARMKSLLDKSQKISDALSSCFIPNVNISSLTRDSVSFIEKVKEYVEAHISEQISMEDIISGLGVSKSKFYRDIKEITEEYSPADIINLVRLGKAVEMMSKGNMNLSEIAFACGFSSASYFSRTFHKYYNISPSDYIRQHFS
ncbi:MAG: substrate-binding domain-containing protein [Bacteroidales bacterium]|nr:substrate-binding domain-containing protein [Bacteroidales bacterium]